MDSQRVKSYVKAAKAIQDDAGNLALQPPLDSGMLARAQMVLPRSLLKGSRGYLEKVLEQVNSTYENGAFDGCVVMIRRLVETLLIEDFERHKIASRIQDQNGDFRQLSNIVPIAIAETSAWNLSRNSKSALPRLKDLGDKGAHSRRFNAHKDDIDRIRDDLRVVVQELRSLAGL